MNRLHHQARLIGLTLMLMLLAFGCTATENKTSPELPIPVEYATYSSQNGLFSISYPPDWLPAQDMLADLEAAAKAYLNSQTSGLPIEQASILFVGGLPPGYVPSVVVVVEPLPSGISTLEQLVSAQIKGLKMVATGFEEKARTGTRMGGIEATLLEYEASLDGTAVRNVVAILKKGNAAWSVTCSGQPEGFAAYKDDLYNTARSLRIQG